jgi:hypothetical protein
LVKILRCPPPPPPFPKKYFYFKRLFSEWDFRVIGGFLFFFLQPNHCLLGPEELVKGIYEFKFFLRPIGAENKKY